MKRLYFLLVSIAAALGAQVSLCAQFLERDAVKVPLKITGYYQPQTVPSNVEIQFESNPLFYRSLSNGAGDVYQTGEFNLKPGKDYQLGIPQSGVRLSLQFDVPPGYNLYINDEKRTRIAWTYFWEQPASLKIRVDTDTPNPFGTSTSLRPDRVVWSVGLGSLQNGRNAGSISLRRLDLEAEAYTPAALDYDHWSPQVERILVSGKLRQVYVLNGLVDIVADNDHAFRLRFFTRTGGQIGSKVDGLYTLTGDPLYEYLVENPTYPDVKKKMRITKTTKQGGQTLVIWSEMEKLGTAADSPCAVVEWVEKPSGATTVTGPTLRVTSHPGWDSEITHTGDGSTSLGGSPPSSGWTSSAVSRESRHYTSYAWGVELTAIGQGDGVNSEGKSFGYASRRVQTNSSTGISESYTEYYTDLWGSNYNQVYRQLKPFADTGVIGPGWPGVAETTTYTYANDHTGQAKLPATVTTTVNNVTSAKTEFAYTAETITDTSQNYSPSSNAVMPLLVTTKKSYYDATHYLTAVTKTYRDDSDPQFRLFAGLPHSTKKPDGTMSVTLYFRGSFNMSSRTFTPSKGGPELLRITLEGTTVISGESASYSSYTLGPPLAPAAGDQAQPTESDFRVTPGQSTAEAAIESADGTLLATVSLICTGTTSSVSWQIIRRDVNAFTDGLFLASTTRDSGDAGSTWPILQNSWSAARINYTVDELGMRNDFTYDNAGRVQTKTRASASNSSASISALTTTYAYDAAGRVICETLSSAGTSETLVTQRTYDIAGRLTSETSPGYPTAGGSITSAVTTTTSYTLDATDNNKRVKTTTLPSGATRIERQYRDGQLQSLTGTSAVAEYYTYGVETDGRAYHRTNYSSASSVRKMESWKDMIGRPMSIARPGFTGQSAVVETNSYDDYAGAGTGRLVKTVKTGFPVSILEYNAMSRTVTSGQDLDATPGLQRDSLLDRVTDHGVYHEYYDGAWWLTTTKTIYPFAGSSVGRQTTKVRTRLTGLTATLHSEKRSYDLEGNESISKLTIDSANKIAVTSTTQPGMVNAKTEKSLNGLPIELVNHDGLSLKKRYDALGRLIGEIEARTGTEMSHSKRISYHPNSIWVKETKDALDKRISLQHYDGAGRVIYSVDSLGNTVRTAYGSRSEVLQTWGSAAYPLSYTYDAYGQRITLRTYRDPSDAALSDTIAFPSLGSADETTWEYDAPSGLLKKKIDAKGRYVEYTYNVRGQLHERIWARNVSGLSPSIRVTATHSYDSVSGEHISTTYNDGTPSIAYTYTRSGQMKTVSDAAGTREFVYDAQKPWRLDYEDLPSSGGVFFYGDRILTHTYESATSTSAGTLASHTLATVLGRSNGFKLGSPGSPSADLELAYPQSNLGRPAGVVTASGSGTVSRTFVYGYETNSSLLKSVALDGSHPFTITREFESARDLVTAIDTKWSTTNLSRYAYAYDDRRYRQSAVQSGMLFSDYGGPDGGAIHHIFSYNGRGEVTGAAAFLGANPVDQSMPLSARRHEYGYDGIGNRRWSNTSGNSGLRDDYAVNELNQYTQKENNTLSVGGTVADNANIKIAVGDRAVSLAGRQGRHWGDNVVLENWAAPFRGELRIHAVDTAANKRMIEARTAFLPTTSQSMTYDEDGNVLNDGVWAYSWDAENRLIAMEVTSGGVAGGMAPQRLEFKYDFMHRRVQKTVLGGWNGATYATVDWRGRYVYQGYNIVAEFQVVGSSLTLARSYTWGLDLSGNLTDAGGVGGLLQIRDNAVSSSYVLGYDANGNVAGLFDVAAGSAASACVAAYEYSPYGESLRCEGSYARANPYRFSTKYCDIETGLSDYGRRFYDPALGRFMGRDPIEEDGGANLYGFTANNPVNSYDILGMSTYTVTYGGVRYNVIPVPISAVTPGYRVSVQNAGGILTFDPSRYGISLAIFWSPNTGFVPVGSIFNYAYLLLPANTSTSPFPTNPVPQPKPPLASKPKFPEPPLPTDGTFEFRPSPFLHNALSKMIPNMGGHSVGVMFNNQGSGTPFIAAGGWDAYTTAVGLYRADPNLYLANGSITDMNDARNFINGLAGKNFGGIVMIGHGNEDDGPLIGHVPVNEELVQLIAETLSPNGPRFVFFANCSAFHNPDIVKQFAEWAKKYNLTFIAANMDVNSPTSGKDPNRIRFGITDGQPDTFQWIMVTPGGIQYFNVNGLPSGIAPVIPPPPGNPGDNNAR